MSDEDYYMNALFLGYILGKNSDKDELVCIPEYLTRLGWIHKTELEKNEQWDKAKIAQLEQENVKLKNEIRELRDDLESERDYADQMEAKEKQAVAENAKLKRAAERDADVMEALNLSLEESQIENAKLRDAMYMNAGKYALQHMDEDELRIWAAQQSEYIEELKKLCKDMWQDIPKTESCGWDTSANHCVGYNECKGECSYWYRMHKLGIEVSDE